MKSNNRDFNLGVEEKHQTIKTVARGGSLIFIGGLVAFFFGYLIRIFVARSIGPDGYGTISLGLAVLGILIPLSLVGTQKSVMRFISYYKARGKMGNAKSMIISSFILSLVISSLFSIALIFLSKTVSINFFHDPNLIPIIQIFSLALPFSVLVQNFNSSMMGLKGVRYYVYTQDFVRNISTLIFIATAIFYFGRALIPISFAYVFGYGSTFLFAAYFMKTKILSVFKKNLKSSSLTSTIKELLAFSWPLAALTVLSLIVSWSDIIFLGYFTNAEDVGIYNAALPTSTIISMVAASFGLIAIPVASELYSKKNMKELSRIYKISTKWIFLASLPIFLFIVFFPQPSLRMLFGSQYIGGADSLTILSIGSFTAAVLVIPYSLILAAGKTKIIFIINFVGAVFSIIMNILIIPVYGIAGAAITKSIAQLLAPVLGTIFIYYFLKIHPFSSIFLKLLAAGLVAMGLIYPLANRFLTSSSSILVLPFAFLYLGVYSILFLLMKTLEKEDLVVLEAVAKKIGMKPEFAEKIMRRFIKEK